MSNQTLDIRYKCLHPSCIVKCKDGVLAVDEEHFRELSAFFEEEDQFRSPKGVCRLGFAQPFKAVEIVVAEEGGESITASGVKSTADGEDPVQILMEEHKQIIDKLEEIQDLLRTRELEKLWIATAELEDDLNKHSAKKEEEVLFPIMKELLPLGEGLVGIIGEEHRELLSLLHAFRSALLDDQILDGIAGSVATNLKSHIRKEDLEFFEIVDDTLDPASRKRLLEGMKEIDRTYEPVPAGDRKVLAEKNKAATERRRLLDEHILAIKDLANVDNSGCGC